MTYKELSIGNSLVNKINKYGRCLELLESIAKQPDNIAPFIAIPYHEDSEVDIPIELRDELLTKMTAYYSEKMADAKAEFVALCNSGETQDDAQEDCERRDRAVSLDSAYSTYMNDVKQKYAHDTEEAHIRADELLCDLLKAFGCVETVREFEDIYKWYA